MDIRYKCKECGEECADAEGLKNHMREEHNLETVPIGEGLSDRLKEELDIAEEKAHKALFQYKFQMFGYWAAIWVHLNRIGGFKLPSPFSGYVKLAKVKKEAAK